MTEFWELVIVFIVLAIVAGALQAELNKNRTLSAIEKAQSFLVSKGCDRLKIKSINYLDEQASHQSLAIFFSEDLEFCKIYNTKDSKYHEVSADKLVQAELMIDEATVTKTNRGSQLVGAAVGGVLVGGVGVVVGGLSGSKREIKDPSSIKIKIKIDDSSAPSYSFHTWNKSRFSVPLPLTYEEAEEESTKIIDLMSLMIRRHEEREKSNQTSNYLEGNDLSSQIKKLHKLLEDGVLTEEEFVAMKRKIIS